MANFTTCELALFLILNKQQVSENLFKRFMKDILQFYKEATLGSNTGLTVWNTVKQAGENQENVIFLIKS